MLLRKDFEQQQKETLWPLIGLKPDDNRGWRMLYASGYLAEEIGTHGGFEGSQIVADALLKRLAASDNGLDESKMISFSKGHDHCQIYLQEDYGKAIHALYAEIGEAFLKARQVVSNQGFYSMFVPEGLQRRAEQGSTVIETFLRRLSERHDEFIEPDSTYLYDPETQILDVDYSFVNAIENLYGSEQSVNPVEVLTQDLK